MSRWVMADGGPTTFMRFPDVIPRKDAKMVTDILSLVSSQPKRAKGIWLHPNWRGTFRQASLHHVASGAADRSNAWMGFCF